MAKTLEDTRKRMIEELKDCGQDIIDRAEEFVGSADCMTDISIDIQFNIAGEESPTITVSREYYPKPMVKRYLGMGEIDNE